MSAVAKSKIGNLGCQITGATSDNAHLLEDWAGNTGGTTPARVIFPRSTEEVAEIVRECACNGTPIIPQGGNTGLVGGAWITNEQAVLLNLSKLNEIEEVDDSNEFVIAQAGAIVKSVQEVAEEAGVSFPLSFGAEGSAQIGGAISTNAGGINVLKYGMTRNLVLGIEVVLSNGQILNLMSGLKKRNEGIDLKQLFIGTEGALGIITKAKLALRPAQSAKSTALLQLSNLGELPAIFAQLQSACGDHLCAAEIVPTIGVDVDATISAFDDFKGIRNPSFSLLVELEGQNAEKLHTKLLKAFEKLYENGHLLDGVLSESLSQRDKLWQMRELLVEKQSRFEGHVRTDLSVQVKDVPELIRSCYDATAVIAPDWLPVCYGHVGDGNIHFNVLPPDDLIAEELKAVSISLSDKFAEIAVSLDGSFSAEHGIGRAKLDHLYKFRTPEEIQLMEALKTALDPDQILNPGSTIRGREH